MKQLKCDVTNIYLSIGPSDSSKMHSDPPSNPPRELNQWRKTFPHLIRSAQRGADSSQSSQEFKHQGHQKDTGTYWKAVNIPSSSSSSHGSIPSAEPDGCTSGESGIRVPIHPPPPKKKKKKTPELRVSGEEALPPPFQLLHWNQNLWISLKKK